MPDQVKKILIVEDQQAMGNVLAHKFKLSGFETLHVSSGDQVIPNLQKEHFDLVLLDIMMLGMDGFEVLKKMRELKLTTPVIMLSNLAQNEDIAKAKLYGAQGYIVKARATPADILKRVSQCLTDGVCY
jgi:DNA-binding response OmpR family regulator